MNDDTLLSQVAEDLAWIASQTFAGLVGKFKIHEWDLARMLLSTDFDDLLPRLEQLVHSKGLVLSSCLDEEGNRWHTVLPIEPLLSWRKVPSSLVTECLLKREVPVRIVPRKAVPCHLLPEFTSEKSEAGYLVEAFLLLGLSLNEDNQLGYVKNKSPSYPQIFRLDVAMWVAIFESKQVSDMILLKSVRGLADEGRVTLTLKGWSHVDSNPETEVLVELYVAEMTYAISYL